MPTASTQPDLFAGQTASTGGSPLYHAVIGVLGYRGSPLFCENEVSDLLAPADRHWLRVARKAGVLGTYFFRTAPAATALRPAVQVAEARTPEEAREIHRRLWNQGINPFLIVVLPAEVRVLAGFAYHPGQPTVGKISLVPVRNLVESALAQRLGAFSADRIDRGEVWQLQARHLGAERRVDTRLLAGLKALSGVLQRDHHIPDQASHALIGQFVYLSYLRARDILSDRWLQEEARLPASSVFRDDTFSPDLTLQGFRALAEAVEKRFNGHLFPISWTSGDAPQSAAVRRVACTFAGDDILTGQIHLPFTAYDFSYIPVELLSAIYEQFLHAEGSSSADGKLKPGRQREDTTDPEKHGAHYTPEPLADYLISEVEAVHPLRPGMKILDACCGSGIFLAIAFRRLVEMEAGRLGRPLRAEELKRLLVEGIFGVERNATACQIAGFSLILALLSYVEPPELHRHKTFRFPRLVGNNLFVHDFFDPEGAFWNHPASAGGFAWVLGNPPWVELKAGEPKDRFVLEWSRMHRKDLGLARARTGEAFAWRVMACLAEGGAAGLILHAKSLTNDHLEAWRKRFFGGVQVHRVTNFANMRYLLFPSAKQPAATFVYTRKLEQQTPILHTGPFVAHQISLIPRTRNKQVWAISFSESEVKWVPAAEAAKGLAATWKMALWGTPRDAAAIRRLRGIFSTRLGRLADTRGWSLSLGLQLRTGAGNPDEGPNHYQADLDGLKVLDHKAFVQSGPALSVPTRFICDNHHGCYVRERGGLSGMKLIEGHRLFLWRDFAAYSTAKFIIRHSRIGLAVHSAEEAKAVACIWSSRYVTYLLFLDQSSEWGVGYSLIDKGDAERLPFPDLTPGQELGLAAVWDEAEALSAGGDPFDHVRDFLDDRVARLLRIPESVALVVDDFFRTRYKLNEGKVPRFLLGPPQEPEMAAYALRLRNELDNYLGGRGRHKVDVLFSAGGVAVSITLTQPGPAIEPTVRAAIREEREELESLLRAAENKVSQWVYVQRSVRLFAGDTIHLIKPPRRLEWTETQALLDAGNVITEVLEARSLHGA